MKGAKGPRPPGAGQADAPQGFVKAALRAARRAYPPGNPQGVFAIDFGPRRCRGVDGAEPTLRLYVEQKDGSAPPPDVVRFSHKGARHGLRPDVVATGRAARAYVGREVRGSGLHPGAPLLVRDGGARWGGVACVLRSGGALYLLTAGHLFRPGSSGSAVASAPSPGGGRRAVGRLFSNLLDLPPGDGDDDPLDAALVELSPEGASVLEATDNPRAPRLANVIDAEATAGQHVQCYRPTSNDYSSPIACSFGGHVVYLSADARPAPVAVSSALRTDFVVTAPGDSGTILCTSGDDRLAAGACAGTDGVGSIFVPIGRSIGRFNAEHGLDLRLWP